MFSDNQETAEALNSLIAAVQNPTRPLIIWIGAGASAWAGYPLWQDLAAKMHSTYSREEHSYNKITSALLLKEGKFPEFFEQMRLANQPRYFTMLSDQFRPKTSNGIYLRLIRALRNLPNVSLVTTNVDEALEHNMPELLTVQRSDLERLPQLMHERSPFVCKLHGSCSSVETMIFSERDYETIQNNNDYLNAIRTIFENSSVLFLGYGLRDDYVLSSLLKSSAARPLFGTGPHFVVTSEKLFGLPESVRRILYVPEVADHRDALQVLEMIADTLPNQNSLAAYKDSEVTSVRKSLYFIADLLPPGKWDTSHTMIIQTSTGASHQMIVGEGYVDGEVVLNNYSALHDIVVGLICFDIVCISIDHLARVHELLGSDAFWIFVTSGSLRLVIPPAAPAIIFSDEASQVGSLGAISLGSNASSLGEFTTIGISERIRRQLLPVIGKENEANQLFQLLESTVLDASDAKLTDSLTPKIRSALMNPSIRRMLGMSLGTPRNSVPRWLSFPTLRLAGVISNGIICQHIQASSTRMIFGSEKLASVAFSAAASSEWADSAASYVLTGKYDSDVGEIIIQEPSLLLEILKFRESAVGENFRREIAQRLAADDGGQIVTAINAGLHQALPSSVLQRARDQLSGLFIPRNSGSVLIPSIWGDLRNSDQRIAGWRKRSRAMLEAEVRRLNLKAYDECPCGSGEKLKFCCQAALA
ncbi:SIR2 family protein [Sideroxydans sp. CL21]|uniref:SIR2 family protein n=1 Tax=Sideroxydans sp. CL21 TaxID=2600596 RepID=UPI0024BC2B78|nr:SIR2 family protein [Sideroxydans sp. CL21]